jgi:DNA-binding transcriptional LysR family regulator
MPDWDDLRIFLACARARTMAAAGRRLGIDETTVSRRVARLSREMGAPLLERSASGLALTPAGEAVRDAAEQMEGAALSAGRRASGADLQLSGRVRVTAPEMLGARFVLPAMLAVRARHPAISFELISTIARLDVTRREADVAIRTVRPEDPGLVARKLARMAMAPYVRKKRRGPLRAIAYVEGIHLPLRALEDRLPQGDIALRTNSIATVLEAVRLGWGGGDLPCFVADELRDLERAFPGEKPEIIDVWLVVHRDLQRAARVRALMDELVRAFRASAAVLERA